MIKNTRTEYGLVSKSIHWLMAGIFIFMFAIAYTMINIPKSDFRLSLFDIHKATGLLMFALFAARLLWRLINPQPALTTIPRWQRLAVEGNIILLYFLMLGMPLSGFLTSSMGGHRITFYHLFTIAPLDNNRSISHFFSLAHEWLSYALIIAFSAHVLGSLYHHFILKDSVLKRMLFNKDRQTTS